VKGWQKYNFQSEKKEEKKRKKINLEKKKKYSQSISLPLITGFWKKKKDTKNTPKPTCLDLSPVEVQPKTPLTKINLLFFIP
jgi:hypothetical protein